MVVHACNPSTSEVEARGPEVKDHSQFDSLRPAWATCDSVLKNKTKSSETAQQEKCCPFALWEDF